MQNDEGEKVDLYIPRKCSYTNRLIDCKDHSAVQIVVGHVDEQGLYTGESTSYALSGFLRNKGQSDAALNFLCNRDGYLQHVLKAPPPKAST